MKNKKVKFSISFKFITIFAILLCIFFSLATFMIFYFVGNDLKEKEMGNNNQINSLVSQNVQSIFQDTYNSVNGYLNSIILLQDDALYSEKANLLFNDLCYRTPELAFVYTQSTGVFAENKFLTSHPEVQEVFILWLEKQETLKKKVIAGRPAVQNISQLYMDGVACLLFPYVNTKTKQTEIGAIGLSTKSPSELVGLNEENPSFVINEQGICILHSDSSKVKNAEDFSKLPFVQNYLKNRTLTEKICDDENGIQRYYDVSAISGSTMFVITSYDPSFIDKELYTLIYRIILVGVFVYFFGLFIILIFSRKIARTIERLVYVTHKIEGKDYKVRLHPHSHDEVGYLTNSVNEMQNVLLERQAQNKLFQKYSNSIVAEKMANGELVPGGINKNATVLYLNIKDFSKDFTTENSPEAVKVLNNLFQQIEACVSKTGGYIDNFYGDTLVAMWGTVDSSGSAVTDAWNCVRCALLIRVAVYEFNLRRKVAGKSLLQICCGINSGVVTAGEIGFSQRTDYTAFGSVIKNAKKIRNMGRAFGTDIFISKDTFDLVCGKIITEELTGDAEIQDIYAVINAIGIKGPGTTEGLKSFLELEK